MEGPRDPAAGRRRGTDRFRRSPGALGTTATVDQTALLRTLSDHGCRFVVVGSTARRLCGADVEPADLDLVVDATPTQRTRLIEALSEADATIARRHGTRRIADTVHLPWDWGWRSTTAHGPIDIVTRFVDGSDVDTHDTLACDVVIEPGLTVRCHPTEHHP